MNDNRLPNRFWAKVVVDSATGCWLWVGATHNRGYGVLGVGSDLVVYAHRFAYEKLVGPIGYKLQLDHLCRVRNCVNPAHLEQVTHAENLRRGRNANTEKTHCPQGHAYCGDNVRMYRNVRYCRACEGIRSRKRRQANG